MRLPEPRLHLLIALLSLSLIPATVIPTGVAQVEGPSSSDPSSTVWSTTPVIPEEPNGPALKLVPGQVRGSALTAGDFDADGVVDLICGFRLDDGRGLATLHRGHDRRLSAPATLLPGRELGRRRLVSLSPAENKLAFQRTFLPETLAATRPGEVEPLGAVLAARLAGELQDPSSSHAAVLLPSGQVRWGRRGALAGRSPRPAARAVVPRPVHGQRRSRSRLCQSSRSAASGRASIVL